MEFEGPMFTDSEDDEEFLPAGLQSDVSSISLASSRSPSPVDVPAGSSPVACTSFDLHDADVSEAASAVLETEIAKATTSSMSQNNEPDCMTSAFLSVPEELLQQEEKKPPKKLKARKKRKSGSEQQDGETKKKKRKKKEPGEKKKKKEPREKKKKSSKPANKRKNIKKFMTEKELATDTLEAQLEEENRKKRLLELQKQQAELQKQQSELQKTMETKAASPPPLKPLPPPPFLMPIQSSTSNGSFHLSALLDKPQSAAPIMPSLSYQKIDVARQIPMPNLKTEFEKLLKVDEPECIVLDSSSSGEEDSKRQQEQQKEDCDVIEISSSDEDVMVDTDDSDGADDDLENSGTHVNDQFNQPDHLGRVLVNVSHPPDEPDIFLAPQLAKAVKPHQIGGIRFLYDNMVESLQRFKSSSGFGCILAHSMGLGKTLQVISFIDVIFRNTTAKSILCIVPINTIQNWMAEFDMWLPMKKNTDPSTSSQEECQNTEEIYHRTFNVFLLNDSYKTTVGRAKVIADWHDKGGVLLMGYEMYRLLTLRKFTLSRRKKKNKAGSKEIVIDLEEEDKKNEMAAAIQKALIRPGPDLVVCDEGHRIKNNQASISQTLKNIRTRRRVVLTGYPLQNNLSEYWCMVDFVRPNFLGTKAEFSNLFERPIMNGQCVDSTYKDIKMMQYRAHVLYNLLLGFVQRRSHSVLQRTLPSKEEHVLLVRLTPIQDQLYHKFMVYFKENAAAGWCSTNPIKAFSMCCKIWNHPDVLYEAIQRRNEAEAAEVDTDLDIPDGTLASSTGTISRNSSTTSLKSLSSESSGRRSRSDVTSGGGLPYMEKINQMLSFDWASDIMKNYKPGVLKNSSKMVLLFNLLDESVKRREKVLVFSQSLFTLTLIENFLSKHPIPEVENAPPDMPTEWVKNKSYFRLDGSSAASEREKMISRFNSSANTKVWLFLLSTRAGCLGVNLVGANNVVIFDASWNPCHDAQAVCRVYRYGQYRKCNVYRFVSDNTLEKKIFDRQISKQGMSDRVIDELNPNVNLTKKEVESLLEYDENDMPYEDFSHHVDKYEDRALKDICKNHSRLLSKEPFAHESLLIDRKEMKLTRAEKKAAKKSYEDEKKMSISYSRPSYSSYYPRSLPSSQSVPVPLAAPTFSKFPITHMPSGNRPVASVRPMQSTPIPMQPSSKPPVSDHVRQRLLNLKQAGVTVQKIVTTTAIYLPGCNTMTSTTTPMINAGETINIIRTQKGMYIRNHEGKIFAVRPGASGNSAEDSSSASMPFSLTGGSKDSSIPIDLSNQQQQSLPAVNQRPNIMDKGKIKMQEASNSSTTNTQLKTDSSIGDGDQILKANKSSRRFSPYILNTQSSSSSSSSDLAKSIKSLNSDGRTKTESSTPSLSIPPLATTVTCTSSDTSANHSKSTSSEHSDSALLRTASQSLLFPGFPYPSSMASPFSMMNYPGLNVPLPPAPPLSYFPVSSLSALAAGSTVVQNPVNPLINSSSMLMNPLLHNPSSYLPGLPYPSVVDPSEVHSGVTSSKKCATNTPVESPPSSKSSAETSKPNMPAVPSESTIDSQLPGLDDSSNQGSSNSSRSSSSNLNFDDMGDLSNLINFTQSNWLSNSMQSVGDIDSSPGDKNAVNRSTDDNSPTSEEKHAAVINLPSDWDI